MAREKSEKLWIGGGAVAAVLLAAGLWAFAVSPKMSEADSFRTQTDDTRAQNMVLETQVGKLQDAYSHISTLRKTLDTARASLPTDSGLSALTRQIGVQAKTAHVTLMSMTAGTPALAGANGQTAAPAPASSSDTSSAPAASTSTTSTTAAGGIFTIPITIVASGSPSADLAFLHAVQQQGPRAALVSNAQISAQGTGTGGTATLTMQMQVFVAPAAVAPTPTATPTPAP
jgi:hypothetical protein